MSNIIETLKKHAWATSLVIVAVYFVATSFPAINSDKSFGRGKGMEDAKSMVEQLPMEIGYVVSILLIIFILGWWRQCGYRSVKPGGLKFTILPFAFCGLILAVAIGIASENNTTIISIIGVEDLLALLLMTLLVGVFEESLFRGILFHGASTKYGPVMVVVITSVIFGAMHFVNFIVSQPLSATFYQMLNAAALGFFYGTLLLRLGALWPLILLHAFWDASVSIMTTTTDAFKEAGTQIVETTAFTLASMMMLIPPLLYGLFVLWRWSKWKNAEAKHKTPA